MLLIAAFAFVLNGARAGVQQDDTGSLVIPICSVDGTRYVRVDIDDDAPAETPEAHCGSCLLVAAIVPEACRLAKPLGVFEAAAFALPKQALPDRSPIWPGAPPTGPPLLT